MDYTTLIADKNTAGSLANYINHASVQSAASFIIAEAESAIYRRLRHWRMKTETTGNMVVGNDYIAPPTDYLEDVYFQILGAVGSQVFQQQIKRKPDQEVKKRYQLDGTGARVQQMPMIFYTSGNGGTPRLKMDSPADKTYPYELTYYQQPAGLSGGNTTNFLTITYPRMLRCALMAGAAEFMKDSGQGNYDRTYWDQLAQIEIDTANAESDRQGRSVDAGMVVTGGGDGGGYAE